MGGPRSAWLARESGSGRRRENSRARPGPYDSISSPASRRLRAGGEDTIPRGGRAVASHVLACVLPLSGLLCCLGHFGGGARSFWWLPAVRGSKVHAACSR
jgi:hypothetical protein